MDEYTRMTQCALLRAALSSMLLSARAEGDPEGCDQVTAELSTDGSLVVGYWRGGVQQMEVCS